jgi:hypothetical protein
MCAYAAHRFLFGRAFARQGRAYLRFRAKNQQKNCAARINSEKVLFIRVHSGVSSICVIATIRQQNVRHDGGNER